MTGRGCTGVILAGGAASRMGGQPKGLLRVGGARIVDRVAAALTEAAGRLVISSNDPLAAEWMPAVPRVADQHTTIGPLGGIQAALSATGTDVLALAWDMPFVPATLLRALRDAGELDGAIIAAPASTSPWGIEPLCAWYSAEALPFIEAQIAAGDVRAGALKDGVKVLTVDVSSWGAPDELFLSVNSPPDLARAEAIAARKVK